MIFSSTTVAITVLSVALFGLLAYVIGKWAFSVDEAAEDRKRAAIRVQAMLTSMGLVRLPRILEAYAVNDWSGLATELKNFAELALDEKAVAAEFEQVFKNVLVKKLATPDGRALVAAMLSDAAQPTDPSVTTAVTATAVPVTVTPLALAV